MTDWKALLDFLHVPNWTEGKNVSPGCVNIRCPHCDDHSNHYGFNIKTGSGHCWRCKGGSPVSTLVKVARITPSEAKKLIEQYSSGSVEIAGPRHAVKHDYEPLESMPGGELERAHIKYLQGRNFRAQQLVDLYGIRGTGPISVWKGNDYRLRVIIPIYDIDGNLVNFQGRDITGRQELRYKCCPVDQASVHHKHLLYGAHLAKDLDRIVVVEGVFDQWRMGPGSVATFGTSLTREQISLLARWPEVVFLFDPEEEAQARARAAARDVADASGGRVWVAKADFGVNSRGEPRDPGDLTPDEARQIMAELLK